MTKLRPLGNNLILRRAAAEERTRGGIIIAESAQARPHRGTVVAAGPGYFADGVFIKTECVEGDTVIFGAGTGHEVQVDGEDFLVVSEDAVIAVVVAA